MITDRQFSILNAIVEDYVELGYPIGSNTIIQTHNVDVSPATIRNEMKLLEQEGLINKTHSSSGRVPSEAGFRLYANQLLTQTPQSQNEQALNMYEMFMAHHFDISSTLEYFARLFSNQIHYTTLVIGPDHSKASIIDIRLIKVNAKHLTVILIFDTGHVKQLNISLHTPINQLSILKVSNYVSQHINNFLKDGNNHHLEAYRLLGFNDEEINLLIRIYFLIHQYQTTESSRVYLGGKNQLIEGLDETTVSSIQPILKYIESNQITDLIRSISEYPISIKIGSEIETDFNDIAILTKPYRIDENLNGYVAVIGPLAMRYQSVIQLLNQVS
ncbi:heat-inducible transcriptional repressor HrcA [Staphylococcus canis]|uniref:Heat-inducible transcription repressor HrcA n=1 Tax=Staphylococcus canis TaxID=2724942 RepID=A0ABS0TAR0_9STAP|nr:heat-inducible transcriptional repressor HrcA [Staphylococcus canis]MBI5975762.1 heat-inducible transcription repressor HrcA [Staphylococcus canis]